MALPNSQNRNVKLNATSTTSNEKGSFKKKHYVIHFLMLALIIFLVIERNSMSAFQADSPSSSLGKMEGSGKATTIHQFTNTGNIDSVEEEDDVYEKVPLYLITSSSRPSLLVKGIFHVLPLRECFDVNWVIVHSAPDERITQAPMFRNIFPWINEIFTYNKQSKSGNYQRNIGLQHVLSVASRGLVYFLDDDNIIPANICQLPKRLSAEKMYYADQRHCGVDQVDTKLLTKALSCKKGSCRKVDLVSKVDTGTFLTPVSLLKKEDALWKLEKPAGTGISFIEMDANTGAGVFYTEMVNALLQNDGDSHRLEQLPPSFYFHYSELNDVNGCAQWQVPWTEDQLHESMKIFTDLIGEMRKVQETLPSEARQDRAEVSFHNYVHILHVLRPLITKPTATFLEIGVWKGATSILMSRHPLETNVVGIDGFFFERQLKEAEQYRDKLRGTGSIDWLQSDSKLAIPEVTKLLNGKEIDILFIDGDHSVGGATADYELYLPLVASGGFIVFDDFFDTRTSSGVRETIMNLIRDGEINLEKYEVFGAVPNVMGAGMVFIDDKYFFDWQNELSNEFVMRKHAK
jgi:predicted O-methyltransferase YrrM